MAGKGGGVRVRPDGPRALAARDDVDAGKGVWWRGGGGLHGAQSATGARPSRRAGAAHPLRSPPRPAPDAGQRPVVFVSWFAAKAYSVWVDGRLPNTAEWEYAGAAGFTTADGSKDSEFIRAINEWYSKPSPDRLPAVSRSKPNVYGIHDLHGLVWEWTSDFNSVMVTGDARGDTGIERQLFCGAGSFNATDRANFPAFLRFGFRSSLKAAYTVHNLGFRCAWDL